MFRIKDTVRVLHAWRHPDQIAREVETELRFHIEMRTASNIESGMTPDEAKTAAVQSFGDFEQVKTECCELQRSLLNSMPLKMGLHITIAILAGLAALWAVNVPHHNFSGVMRQVIAIAVLGYLFVVVRRARSEPRSDNDHLNGARAAPSETLHVNRSLTSGMLDTSSGKFAAYDEQGRTPVERMFKS
jgi:hypothetical protein